jgi:DNA polymerase I
LCTDREKDVVVKKVFLLDLMAIFYRTHMAMDRNPLTTENGMVVSGIHGVFRTIARIVESENPDAIIVTTDVKAPTFRHKLFPDYKAHRKPMPEDMVAQLPVLYELLEMVGLPAMQRPGWEADDLLATLALKAQRDGYESYIVTGDKDLMQVVRPGIYLYTTKKGGEVHLVGEAAVRQKFGVDPTDVIEVLALMGDASDNVPGVPRVGQKTAADLVQRFGKLEGIYENLEELGKKAVRGYLEQHRDLAFLSRDLVTIDCEAPVKWEPDKIDSPKWDDSDLQAKMLSLGMRAIHAKLLKLAQSSTATPSSSDLLGGSAEAKAAPVVPSFLPIEKRDYRMIDSEEVFEKFLIRLLKETGQGGALCSFDTETTGLNSLDCKLVGMSFCWEDEVAWFLPSRYPGAEEEGDASFGNLDLFASVQDQRGCDCEVALQIAKLKPWFENANCKKLGQNAKFDMHVLSQYGVQIEGFVADTMLASFVLNPAGRRHDLDTLSLERLALQKVPTADLIGKGAKQISMADVPVEVVSRYACEDAHAVFLLWKGFQDELKQAALFELFEEVDMPMSAVLARMEENGVRLNLQALSELSDELGAGMSRLKEDIFSMAGEEFNVNSPKQLSTILFENLKLKPGKKTSTGYSTNEKELERLAKEEPLPKRLLEYRHLAKLKGTYADALPKLINPKSKRVHSSFNLTVAATGRLSSTDPNLQNIPVRSEWGRRIRQAFIASGSNRVLIDVDYSQIELRLLAHISQDEELTRAFNDGADVHTRTASAIFSVPESEVSKEMRSQAKVVNFGVIYGMGPFALAGTLGVPISEAKRFIDGYFELYSGVKTWSDKVRDHAREHERVENLFGRVRFVQDINSDNRQVRENYERIAVNTPIQSAAADLIKKAMISIDTRIRKEALDMKMLLQVHDELLFDVPREKAEAYAQIIQHEMEQTVRLSVPLLAEPGLGENWLEAK